MIIFGVSIISFLCRFIQTCTKFKLSFPTLCLRKRILMYHQSAPYDSTLRIVTARQRRSGKVMISVVPVHLSMGGPNMDLFKLVYLGTLYSHGDPPSSPPVPPLQRHVQNCSLCWPYIWVGFRLQGLPVVQFIIVTFNIDLFDWKIVTVEYSVLTTSRTN